MCLAIPALVKSVDGFNAEVEIGGIQRNISIQLTPEVQKGDYVLIHTGYSISIIDSEEAEETMKLLLEMADAEESLMQP
ncbi:MAG: HypC/HybG/HupF family hydrogenase formation chaperone [Dehalococcoidales bacterium]|jgi:hydrogenase expression/formation protein HypC|nr:HypC/HybG/HupF family hydrogenase formation chaperone [Dehalococcoidales bacterium]